MRKELLERRDVLNFMTWRDAEARDDALLAQFLLATFAATNARKRPDLVSTAERVNELLDVAGRRASGVVRVVDIGHRVVGTYALMRPGAPECAAWVEDCAYLRAVAIAEDFQGIALADALLTDAVAIARIWGVPRMCLHIVQDSGGLERLYRRHGFERDARGDQFASGFELEGYQLVLGQAREAI